MKMKVGFVLAALVGIFSVIGFLSFRASSQLTASLVALADVYEEDADDSNNGGGVPLLENLEIDRDDDGNVTVVATEKDINTMIQHVLLQEERLRQFVRGASVRILNGYLEFQANMRQPLTGNFFVRAKVTVQDGRLVPEIMKVKYGIFAIPAKVIVSTLNAATKTQSPSEWIKTPDIMWQSVAFTTGKIVIRFQEK